MNHYLRAWLIDGCRSPLGHTDVGREPGCSDLGCREGTPSARSAECGLCKERGVQRT